MMNLVPAFGGFEEVLETERLCGGVRRRRSRWLRGGDGASSYGVLIMTDNERKEKGSWQSETVFGNWGDRWSWTLERSFP